MLVRAFEANAILSLERRESYGVIMEPFIFKKIENLTSLLKGFSSLWKKWRTICRADILFPPLEDLSSSWEKKGTICKAESLLPEGTPHDKPVSLGNAAVDTMTLEVIVDIIFHTRMPCFQSPTIPQRATDETPL